MEPLLVTLVTIAFAMLSIPIDKDKVYYERQNRETYSKTGTDHVRRRT